jgi:hypothetical protein
MIAEIDQIARPVGTLKMTMPLSPAEELKVVP